MSDEQSLCSEVDDSIAEVLDGTAPRALFDHIATCDACRDKKHDAARAAELVASASADFRQAEDVEALVMNQLDARASVGAAASSPSARPHAVAVTVEPEAPRLAEAASTTQPSPSSVASSSATRAAVPRAVAAAEARAASLVEGKGRRSVPLRVFVASALVAMSAAAAVGFLWKGRTHTTEANPDAAWSGSVASVSRAGADKQGGLQVCDAKGACGPIEAGAAVGEGTTLRTDARTRARVALADGTEIAIDRATSIAFDRRARTATLTQGTLVADVAHVEGHSAHLLFPGGDVEVVGTKLSITAAEDRASVEVARGEVRVATGAAKPSIVRAGEEATITKGGACVVANASSLAEVMEWSDKSAEEVDAPVLRGLGELRARKPGETKEKDRAVRLAKHSAKVRIVDVAARTEIDETFTNDTDEELEGIFRFPLPPGAQIERLALEVDGKLVEGAFVDREKGAAIWRGVIQNAAPKAPKPKEEIFWVPGPWRDPALLEWQKGGRFELKIFPIPRRGSRRIVIAYTELVAESAGLRRYTLPLAHDARGTTRIDAFDVDLQVLGADPAFAVATRGYELTRASAGNEGDRRTLHESGFVPAGDLTVEYALPDRDKEVTAWAYARPISESGATTAESARDTRAPEQKIADEAARGIAGGESPFVAITLRPKLPRWQESKERVHAIVVDASRSMFGERFARATHLAASIVREMDRRDTFVVLACDTTCRAMGDDGIPKPQSPGAAAAESVERFLADIEPDGGSDLSEAMRAARDIVKPQGAVEMRIEYLGDGTPTVGPTRAAHLESAVKAILPAGEASVVAVALGADADAASLEALARGGGGVVVPYVPGQRVASAALDVLAAAYGEVLRDPEIELPAGLGEVMPVRLDPIRAGGEALVLARMTGHEVSGSLKLRGRVAGEKFEQTYPLKIVASTSAGNAFVPRLYASAKIAELERDGGETAKPAAIALSRAFSVASRFTSLLVLESPAMFKAFGLEGAHLQDGFTGEQTAESSNADGDVVLDPEEEDQKENPFDDSGAGKAEGRKGGFSNAPAKDALSKGADKSLGSPAATRSPGFAQPPAAAAAPAAPPGSKRFDDGERDRASASRESGRMSGPMQSRAFEPDAPAAVEKEHAAAPPPPPPMNTKAAPSRPADLDEIPAKKPRAQVVVAEPKPVTMHREIEMRRRGFVPMKKVFDRKLAFDATNTLAIQNASKVDAAVAALRAAPDSRDKTTDLYALFATTERFNEAQELTTRWAGRDALDPDALAARADLAARQGDRARAVRILGGLVDVRPNDRAGLSRLADLHDAAGETRLGCEHRITLAELAGTNLAGATVNATPAKLASGQRLIARAASKLDARVVADGVRCARDAGLAELASRLELDAGDGFRTDIEAELAASRTVRALAGDVRLSAEWSGDGDLDLALVDAQGRRTSWLGTPLKNAAVTTRDATNPSRETIAIANLPQGSYLVEISRATGGDAGTPSRGTLTLTLGSETRRIPFTLTSARTALGTIRVAFTSRLVPAN